MNDDRCPACGKVVTLLERGEMKVHFASNAEVRPCFGSWKTVEDTITPAQSSTNAEMGQRIRRRIEKLLALARSNSEVHESSAARRRAEELMVQHGIKVQ